MFLHTLALIFSVLTMIQPDVIDAPQSIDIDTIWSQTSRPLQQLLDRRAEHFVRLPDGTVIDRTAEMQYRAAMEKARSKSRTRPRGGTIYPTDPTSLAWGISKKDGIDADTPPMWHSLEGEPLPNPVYVGMPIGNTTHLTIINIIELGSGLCDQYFRGFDQYTPPHSRVIHVTNLPHRATAGGMINGPIALIENEPRYYQYPGNSAESFQYFEIEQSILNGKELLELILLKDLELVDWKFRKAPQRRDGKVVQVYTWNTVPFEPRALKVLKLKHTP